LPFSGAGTKGAAEALLLISLLNRREEIAMATAAQKRKVHKVMGEKKRGTLRSGSGKKVKSRKQAIAIAMSESGQSWQKNKRRKKRK
jgi:hypothetical protein